MPVLTPVTQTQERLDVIQRPCGERVRCPVSWPNQGQVLEPACRWSHHRPAAQTRSGSDRRVPAAPRESLVRSPRLRCWESLLCSRAERRICYRVGVVVRRSVLQRRSQAPIRPSSRGRDFPIPNRSRRIPIRDRSPSHDPIRVPNHAPSRSDCEHSCGSRNDGPRVHGPRYGERSPHDVAAPCECPPCPP